MVLPVDDVAPADVRRRDELAQALCGCWVRSLSESGVARLLRAVASGDGFDSGFRDSDSSPRRSGGSHSSKATFRPLDAGNASTPRLRYSMP